MAIAIAFPAHPLRAKTRLVRLPGPAPVVVATFDTGTNPFHPCFRRDWTTTGIDSPADLVRNYPGDAEALSLTFADTYEQSLAASKPVLESIQSDTLYYVPETNLSFYGLGATAADQFVDEYPHGAQASSQIGCERYGLGSNAHLVILNWYAPSAPSAAMVKWAADQPWIDVIHLNIQDFPCPYCEAEEIPYAISKGKFLVIAAGNGVAGALVNYPMELSRFNGPRGSLIAGANDNGGWTLYSNLNPHVVMDGGATVAAQPDGYGDTTFSGTSSSSPRVAGFVARLLGELRAEFGHTGQDLLTIPKRRPRPATGPLADGALSAPELHEAIRKTADPNPHESAYDGGTSIYAVPQPADSPFAVYAKMGYGEISEHTLPHAVAVLAGRETLPERPNEDFFFNLSEEIRRALWG